MIQAIANVVYQVATIHGHLLVGKQADVVVDHLADVEPETMKKWTDMVVKIIKRDYTSVDDILFDQYGANYQGALSSDTYVLYDTILTIVSNLADARDQSNGTNWRHDID